ncbi:MAG: ABC transporter ATP-binding protein [Candidatus Aminicenantes bacterium]|nr:ABC transporter ATP-binding protein [Candidatus Aminicenantes bacterium]
MEYALEIRNLSKSYGDFRLKDVSFSLPRGYIMGLIGPNGAGKTTIIKLVLNLIRRDGGEIRALGFDNLADEVEIKSRIGFVHDTPFFYEHLTLANVRKTVAPFYRDWDDALFRRLADEFRLPLGKRFKKLSRGTKMKFALAVALSHKADLLILDEPTSGLDPVFRRELLQKLSAFIQDEGKSVLFSTHITSDLERIADFITFIRGGEIVFSSPRDQILGAWAVVKGGPELLAAEHRALFKGHRQGAYGVQALTAAAGEVHRRFGRDAVVETATLEEIMFYMTKGNGHA